MKKTLLPLLVGASMMISTPASAEKIQKSKREITQTLSIDEDHSRIEDMKLRQEHIQRLVSQIKEPIIL
jgi:hypothetical protein